jgi:hypothetical protein
MPSRDPEVFDALDRLLDENHLQAIRSERQFPV